MSCICSLGFRAIWIKTTIAFGVMVVLDFGFSGIKHQLTLPWRRTFEPATQTIACEDSRLSSSTHQIVWPPGTIVWTAQFFLANLAHP
ncbi:hypothetical protein NC77_12735 [Janthinobacterium lividum]|nr:hypothetical protein NC77_12735 [Janthinobacterium lividum]